MLTARVGNLLVCCVYAPYGNPSRRGIDGALAYKITWLNYGFNPQQPPTTRLQLILGNESVAKSVASVCVDLKYRAPIDALVGKTWPASAPVIADLG